MATAPDMQAYREKLSAALVQTAHDLYSEGSTDDRATERVARGLLDVADFIVQMPDADEQLRSLAAFYPDPTVVPEVLRDRSADPRRFRRDDPDERIVDYIDTMVTGAIDSWADWGGDPIRVSAHNLVSILEDDDAPLDWKLAAVSQLDEYLDFLEEWLVQEARDHGWSWARIAAPLRRSRQAIQQKYASLSQANKPW